MCSSTTIPTGATAHSGSPACNDDATSITAEQSNGTSTTEDANDTTEPGNAAAATE